MNKVRRILFAVAAVLLLLSVIGCDLPISPYWNAFKSYQEGEVAQVDIRLYISLQDSNQGHYPPDTVGVWWRFYKFED